MLGLKPLAGERPPAHGYGRGMSGPPRLHVEGAIAHIDAPTRIDAEKRRAVRDRLGIGLMPRRVFPSHQRGEEAVQA